MSNSKLFPLLRYFHALAQYGSFTKAAEVLHVSQSTVSIQVKKLETLLGYSLIDRASKHKFQITSKGKTLAEQCAVSFGDLNDVLDCLQQDSPYAGELNLASSMAFGYAVILPVIAALARTYPQLKINLQQGGIAKDFFADNIDIAVHFGEPRTGYFNSPLTKISKRIVASEEYLKGRPPVNSLNDLAEHNLLMQRQGKREWPALLDQYQLTLKHPQFQCFDNNLSKMKAAELGLGIAILPDYLVTGSTHGKLLVILPDMDLGLDEQTYLICEKRRLKDPKVKLVLEQLQKAIALKK